MHSKRNSLKKQIYTNNTNNTEDEQIKSIIKEINNNYKNTLFFEIRPLNKRRNLFRSKSNLSCININSSRKKLLKNDNSLTFQLKNKIKKESLILELRQELKYHIKFNYIYKNYLSRIITLKDAVKENRDKVEENTNMLKESFKEQFDIIQNYEKTISLLETEKKELMTSSDEILKMRESTNRTLLQKFSQIQEQNNEQRLKIENLSKNIYTLENKKAHINDELQSKFDADEKNYEKNLKLYKSLLKKYKYYLDEYNSYNKSGEEITSIDVKLFDNTNARNSIMEEDLKIELNEKIIQRENLLDNINILKNKIKILEQTQNEEKFKESKKSHSCKYIRLYKSNMRNSNNFRRSASSKKHK